MIISIFIWRAKTTLVPSVFWGWQSSARRRRRRW